MDPYCSNTTLKELADRIRGARRILLTTHSKPDGDGLGSVLALARALAPLGKKAEIYLMGPIEPVLIPVIGPTPYVVIERGMPPDEYDLAVVADTGSFAQLEPLDQWLREHHECVIGLDHHPRGEAVASMRLVDPTAGSTTQMIVGLLDELGCELTGGEAGVAEALFVGLATDTGWFKYSAADAEAFRVAARLLLQGVDKSRLYQMIEETFRPERMALEARALASLEYHGQPTVAVMTLTIDDFAATGGDVTDLTGLVNAPLIVGSVRGSVLLAETRPGRTKMSFRSKPPAPESPDGSFIDVNRLAQRFGGGGHAHAAGARMATGPAEARQALLAALAEAPALSG